MIEVKGEFHKNWDNDQLLEDFESADLHLLRPFLPQTIEQNYKIALSLKANFDRLFVVGVGGSSTGAQCLVDFLGAKNVVFINTYNTEALNNINARDGFLVVSKSGGTIETLSLCNSLCAKLKEKELALNKSVFVITEDKDSPLCNWARSNDIKIYFHSREIGGRYSVFTNVGLLPGFFAGLKPTSVSETYDNLKQNPKLISQFSEMILNCYNKKKSTLIFWADSHELSGFCCWLQQLWAESLGKDEKLGLTPMATNTPYAQHSIQQEVLTCGQDKCVIFFSRPKSSEAQPQNLFPDLTFLNHPLEKIKAAQTQATAEAMTRNSILTYQVNIQNETDLLMGLLAWQLAIVNAAKNLEVNPFDQPAVELGKKLTKEILSQ